MKDLPEPIPAASLIIMRKVQSGPPELLLLERTQSMAFAAGAVVFPGGRVDPEDEILAAQIGVPFDDAARRIAAIRETIEEAGIAVAVVPEPRRERVREIRLALEQGVPFSVLLERSGLRLDLGALIPLARWCPPPGSPRRFDTIFFVAEARQEVTDASPALAEATRVLWASAACVLRQADEGEALIVFPTRRNLERVSRFQSLADARADTARHPLRTIEPWVEERNGVPWVRIPDGVGYEVTAELLATARPEPARRGNPL